MMEWVTWSYLILVYNFFLVVLVIIPAALNITLGFREKYVGFLLRVFKVRQNIYCF